MEKFCPITDGQEVDVLVVEDEKLSRLALALLLAGEGYTTTAAASGEEAINILLSVIPTPSVVLIDFDLPGMSGAELVAYLKKVAPLIRLVFLTAADQERVNRAVAPAKIRYLRKPFNFRDLLGILREDNSTN